MFDKTEYQRTYKRDKLKRIPLDVPKQFYEDMKEHCEKMNEPINTFIKLAVTETILRDNTND